MWRAVMSEPRWFVRRVVGKVYMADPNVPLWEVIDRQTGERVVSDVFEGKEVAERQATIYNEQGGPTRFETG